MIEIKNLSFAYDKKQPVLRSLNLNIHEGGIYGLLGQNGVGKSTLLHLLCGLLTPSDGEILFDGENVRLRRPSTLSETFIVPEEFNLPAITMAQYCKINAPFYPKFSIDDLKDNLALFNLNVNDNLATLSMGQKKKAFMCFALACNTKLLIMDEPTNGLDIPSKVQFRRFIASHMSDDRIIIISTHQVHDIELLLDHVIILDSHDVVLDSAMSDISSKIYFTLTPPNDPEKIIYQRKVFGATAYICMKNQDDPETEINLETLYLLCCEYPEKIKDILS
ncbi:MAG: ATP-binding cassette domain-containing protein [Muribaculaceae bacterium]